MPAEEHRVIEEMLKALKQCAYPEWAFKQPQPKQRNVSAATSDAKSDKPKCTVVLQFAEVLSQRVK